MNKLDWEQFSVNWHGACGGTLCCFVILMICRRGREQVTQDAKKRWLCWDAMSEQTGTLSKLGAMLMYAPRSMPKAASRLLQSSRFAGWTSRHAETGAYVPGLRKAPDAFAAAQGPSVIPALMETPKNLSAMKEGHRQDQPSLPLSGGRSLKDFSGLRILRFLPPHLGNQMCSAGTQLTLRVAAGMDKKVGRGDPIAGCPRRV
jgi:hypothetical protein